MYILLRKRYIHRLLGISALVGFWRNRSTAPGWLVTWTSFKEVFGWALNGVGLGLRITGVWSVRQVGGDSYLGSCGLWLGGLNKGTVVSAAP